MVHKKNGFTLVELLAVIVIMGLILVIVVPKITQTIQNSKKKTLELTAKNIAKSAEEKYIENDILGLEEEISCESILEISNNDYSLCILSFSEDGDASVSIKGKGRYKGLYVCDGTKVEAEATDNQCESLSSFKVVPASYVAASSLIGLGVTPGSNTNVFTQLVEDTVDYLGNQGLVVGDNLISLLSMDDSLIPYMVDKTVIEKIREYIYDSSIVYETTTVSTTGFTSDTLTTPIGYYSDHYTAKTFNNLVSDSPENFISALKSLGVNDKVMISGVYKDSPYYLFGVFFDSNGQMMFANFENPLGGVHYSQPGIYSLQDLILVESASPWWTDGSYSYRYPVYYNADYADANYSGQGIALAIDFNSNPIYGLGDRSNETGLYFFMRDFSLTEKWSASSTRYRIYSFSDLPYQSPYCPEVGSITWNTSSTTKITLFNENLKAGKIANKNISLSEGYTLWARNAFVDSKTSTVYYPVGIGNSLDNTILVSQNEVWAGKSSY